MGTIYLPLYHLWNEMTKSLSDEEFGHLVRALLAFDLNGTETSDLSPAANIAYMFMTESIRQSHKKAEAGRKGMENRWGENKCVNNKPITTQKQTNNDPITIREKIKDKSNNKKEEIHKEEKKNPLAVRFARFWSVYPKKVGKGAAEKAFLKLRPSEELTDCMISAVEAQARSEQWKRDKGQYIPNPATWLNQGRWEDSVGVSMPSVQATEEEEEYPF